MGAKRIFVGGLSISDMKKITSIAQNNSQLKSLTIHYFRRSIITSLSFKTSLAEERFILAAERIQTARI
jgi:hypothetical protein